VRYRLSKEEILECCKEGYQLGFRTFVLQGGEDGHYTVEDIGEIVSPKECVINLFGHTHQFDDFYDTNDGYNFRMYHVGVDSHDCFPVPIDEVIEEIKVVFQKSKDKWNAYYGNN
jgi:hypothetical protein